MIGDYADENLGRWVGEWFDSATIFGKEHRSVAQNSSFTNETAQLITLYKTMPVVAICYKQNNKTALPYLPTL